MQDLLDQEREERMLIETTEYMKTRIMELETQVNDLRNKNEFYSNRAIGLDRQLTTIKEELQIFITENYSGNEEMMTALAECAGVETEKIVNFVVEVRFEGTATVPFYMDVETAREMIEGEIQFSGEYVGSGIDEVYLDETDVVFSDFVGE